MIGDSERTAPGDLLTINVLRPPGTRRRKVRRQSNAKIMATLDQYAALREQSALLKALTPDDFRPSKNDA